MSLEIELFKALTGFLVLLPWTKPALPFSLYLMIRRLTCLLDFGEIKTCLHLAIDKATSTIVGAYFDKQETLNGYYHVFYQILTNYGIPYKFFTDNRTVFNYIKLNPDKRTSDKDVLTQYSCFIFKLIFFSSSNFLFAYSRFVFFLALGESIPSFVKIL